MWPSIEAIMATALVAVFYLFATVAVRSRWEDKLLLNPLKITAESNGRASLSKTQVFFFTMVVAWLSIYWVMRGGGLIPFDNSILFLLGVAAGGAGLGRVAGGARARVTGENLAWAKNKGWVKKDFTRTSISHVPKFSDLLSSDQGLEVSRLQAVVFSVIVGISLLYEGATAKSVAEFSAFTIDDSYLALIGISQGVYIGGKCTGESKISNLNVALDKVRKLELAFTKAVIKSENWLKANKADHTMQFAHTRCAPDEYLEYISAATEAAGIVEDLTGNEVGSGSIQPQLPTGWAEVQ